MKADVLSGPDYLFWNEESSLNSLARKPTPLRIVEHLTNIESVPVMNKLSP